MTLQLLQIIWAPIGKFTFEKPPDTLIGIKLRRIRGEVLKMQPHKPLTQLGNLSTPMRVAVIQEGDQMASQMLQYLMKEYRHLLLAYVVSEEHPVQPQVPPSRADRQSGDH
jgi:hypothetical protein